MKKSTFIIFCLEGAILFFNVAACAALVPSIARELNVSQFSLGSITWAYMLPYGIAALFYGPLVRIIDARKIELTCFLLFSLANLMSYFSRDLNTLFIARFLTGTFGASVIPLVLILIGRHVASKNRGRLVGIFFGVAFAASLTGLFLSGFIYWRFIFLIPALCGFLLWFVMYLRLPRFQAQARNLKINYLEALRQKNILFIFSYIFLISLFYHGVQPWLAVYFYGRFNFSQFIISMLITLTSFSGIFGEILGGRLADNLGRARIASLGIILMIFSVFALIFKWPLLILAVLMIIWGFGWTFNHAGLSTILTDLPDKFLPEAASLNSSVRFISGGIGAALGGAIMQRSFTNGFLIFGAALILLVVFSKRLLTVKAPCLIG